VTGEPSPRSRAVAGIFDRAAATYDQVGVPWFTPIAESLVEQVGIRTGERVLDVGCGRGAVLFAAAEAVGPGGRVTGVDLAPAMVQATAAEIGRRGLTQARVRVGDAAAPGLDEPGVDGRGFDVLTASLVLFFLPEPLLALRAWRELLTPGGRVGVTTFGRQDPRWVAVDDVFTPYLPAHLLDARSSGARGPFADDAGVQGLLTDAGFVGVTTTVQRIAVSFRDAAQWQEWSWSHGQRVMWESVPEPERPVVLTEAARRLESLRDQQGSLTTWQDVRLTTGRRPD
jgi:ubiquinone/menaquinone biosynthesis C-methylase UbiE